MRAFLTPTNAPAQVIARRIFVPADYDWVALLSGALVELTYADNWEQYPGQITPVEASDRAREMFLRWLQDDGMIGTITAYVTTNPPFGVLPCDGATHQRVDYPALYALLDPAFITGPDTFATPDLRGRTIIGVSGSHTINQPGGAETITLTPDQMPVHTHTNTPHTHSEITATPVVINGGVTAPAASALPGIGVTGASGIIIDNAGGGQAHDNMPPYVPLAYGIYAL